jgi:Zn-dependent protease with chaperone function
MTVLGMGLIVSLAVAGATLAIMTLASAATWRLGQQRLARLAPHSRARAIATLRLLPAAAALAAAGVVLIAFIRLEPADAREALGVVLPAAALATVFAFIRRAAHAIRAWTQTARIVAEWKGTAPVVDVEFPIVAVIGIWRPRLYVARRVVEACDREELDAMIAHERAHIAARDNVTRLCFLCAPFVVRGVAPELEIAWTRASEEAADDAARRDESSSLALASALTKVARLAMHRTMPLLQASAIFSGSSVSERIQRMLDTPVPVSGSGWQWRYVFVLSGVTVGAFSIIGMRYIHDAAEYCVRYLP